LQPRDPDTGHFTYNADANLGLKYPQRGKGAVPVGAKNWILSSGIKKGDKVVIDDSVWIAIEDLDENKLKDYFKRYDEEAGEYVSTKDDKADKFSTNFIKKRGRVSKEEKSEMAAGEKVVGDVDLSSLGKYSQNDMSAKFAEKAKAYTPSMKSSAGIAKIGSEKQASNAAHNEKVDAEQKKAEEEAKAKAKENVNTAGAGSESEQPKQTSPFDDSKQEEPKEETKEEVTETKVEEKPYKPSKNDIVSNPKKEYEAHKEYWDNQVAEYNKKNGTSHSAAWLVQALAKKYGSKK
jgi:hypothetical protein